MADKWVLREGVKTYALANYERDGWDYIVETYTDADIEKAIGKARTLKGAIAKVKAVATLLDDRRRDMTPVEGWDY